MSLYYIGGFPPPYGGVTTKNENLFKALSEKTEIKRIDFNEIKRKNLKETVNFIKVLLNKKNKFVVGVAGKNTRKRLCKILYTFNRVAMKKSIIMLMGGTVADDIAADKDYQKYVSAFKKVYAETQSMVLRLKNAGMENADYYPNCRFRTSLNMCKREIIDQGIKCIFFSLIRPEKGADIVLDTAKELKDISFSFYGPIEKDYKDEFTDIVNKLPNVQYHGIFTGTKDETYQELGKYDVLLFPTRYDIEGVPGILVESKIAGITSIVSNKSYNAEIISDNVDGIVLQNNTVTDLKAAILKLNDNSDLLQQLSQNAFLSADNFYIENYIDEIINTVDD